MGEWNYCGSDICMVPILFSNRQVTRFSTHMWCVTQWMCINTETIWKYLDMYFIKLNIQCLHFSEYILFLFNFHWYWNDLLFLIISIILKRSVWPFLPNSYTYHKALSFDDSRPMILIIWLDRCFYTLY